MDLMSLETWRPFLTWVGNGFLDLAWWQLVIYTLVVTHLTILGVTIFLHRAQAHRALTLHPIPEHFLRFWLWLTTGMITKEFVAIHRKHHAKCETEEDPHSPQTRGLKKLLLEGTELYRAESRNLETMQIYGRGTPNDWIEKALYSKHSRWGVVSMLIIDVACFGAIGASIWAIQMLWIPVWATGVINGIGHYWGYRNFETPDASTNVSLWGIIVGGEELHNNHHTYPTSAKFSVKRYEFDIGWMYISLMEKIGWATVKKLPPKLSLGSESPDVNSATLQALVVNRYEIMDGYAKAVRRVFQKQVAPVMAKQGEAAPTRKIINKWLHRDEGNTPSKFLPVLSQAREAHPVLDKMVEMREQLRQMWTNTSASQEQLVAELVEWCKRAEASGIQELVEFSVRLRKARV